MQTQRIFGIDLGTTYSCISYVDEHGKPVTVQNFEGDLTTPSVVYFESAENTVVGKHAKNASRIYPDRVASFIKRSMGNGEFTFDVDGHSYSPEEISSLVLRKVVADASQTLGGEPITDVVITCPAYFGVSEREATKNAGVLAGLNVHHILNEPTAAAICYGMDRSNQDQVVLVYDLGGGTFDVTVIAINEGAIQVVVTGGNHSLGGKDWDDRLINHFAEAFVAAYPDAGDPRDDAQSLQELATEAEEAKKGLSVKEKWPYMVSHNGFRARVEVTRAEFEAKTADLLDQTIEITRQLLRQAAERGFQKVDEILLVGGSSKMPAVGKALQQAFGMEAKLFDPDQAVAKGAALMGLKIAAGEALKEVVAAHTGVDKASVDLTTVDDKTLQKAAEKVAADSQGILRLPGKDLVGLATQQVINVSSKGFGIVVAIDDRGERKEVAYLIHNNTALPAELTQTNFGTLISDQANVSVEVMEQAGQIEDTALENNRLIVDGLLQLPPNLPANSPIHVTFRLGEDGTLSVTAIEPSSNRDIRLEARVEGVMSEAEVEARKTSLLRLTVS